MTLPTIDFSKDKPSTHALIKQLVFRILGINDNNLTGSDRSGVCGGTVAVTPGATVFTHPCFIENTGVDGTITGEDEYGETVTSYPMTAGKITPSRWRKVASVTAGVVVWRHYSV